MMRLPLVLILTLAALVERGGTPRAPVPDRAPDPTPPNGRVHGDWPTTVQTDLSYLMRACLRCHGVKGPNTRMFDESRHLLPGQSKERLRKWLPLVLRPGSEYGPYNEEERRDLVRAMLLLRE